jgi:ribonucleoside-diphosphate reductase beta chain
MIQVNRPARLLDPGLCLTLRPMSHPRFFEMYRAAIKNTWTVEEVDFATDVSDLAKKMTDAERHLVQRLIAFFATGDSIVANNLVLNLYKHINAPEARMYLSRQLYEEALHVQFYLTLLDTYVPDPEDRHRAFAAVENIPSVQKKAAFCMRWLDSVQGLGRLGSREDRRRFLLNLICFAACIEGLFFFGAFAYVYFLRSRGLLHGLAAGTNWVFRDESAHMAFAFEVVKTVRREEPELFDDDLSRSVLDMVEEAPAWSGCPCGTCAVTWSSARTSGSPRSVSRSDTEPRTRSRSWISRTSRRSRTSSNDACRPTRSA